MQSVEVAFIGAGRIGLSWAVRAALHGFTVTLWDIRKHSQSDIENRIANVAPSLTSSERAKAAMNIKFCDELSSAVESSQVIFECITEDLPQKRQLYSRIEVLAQPRAILATSTSAFPTRSLFRAFKSQQRSLVAHPMNPPHQIPLVEIVPHAKTHPESIEVVADYIRQMGQFPIILSKEIEGFVANRLQAVVLNEAMRLIALGVCDASAVDNAFIHGFAPRWQRTGPMTAANEGDDDGFAGFARHMGRMMNWIERQHNNIKPWNDKTVEKVKTQLETGEHS